MTWDFYGDGDDFIYKKPRRGCVICEVKQKRPEVNRKLLEVNRK